MDLSVRPGPQGLCLQLTADLPYTRDPQRREWKLRLSHPLVQELATTASASDPQHPDAEHVKAFYRRVVYLILLCHIRHLYIKVLLKTCSAS